MFDRIFNKTAEECFQDIRYEKKEETIIRAAGGKIIEITQVNNTGGIVRAFAGGSFCSGTFCNTDEASDILKKVTDAAIMIKGDKRLSKVEKISDNVKISLKCDARNYTKQQKADILKEYITAAEKVPGVVSVFGMYIEENGVKYYKNNEGTEVSQDILFCAMPIFIKSIGKERVYQLACSLGGNDNFEEIINGKDTVTKTAELVCKMADTAQQIESGNYDVILSPELAGMFLHEAFGHFSEADIVIKSKELQKTMSIGNIFGNKDLTIYDDPEIEHGTGSYVYDDEGVKSKKTIIVKNGVLVGRLHSRESADIMNEPSNGHCRAINYSFKPIVRMGNICMEPGSNTLDQMIESTENGVFLFGLFGGCTVGSEFTVNAQGGYIIKNGKIEGLINPCAVSGNLYTALKNIDMIGNKIYKNTVGACGKDGQYMRKSGSAAPYIKIKNISVG